MSQPPNLTVFAPILRDPFAVIAKDRNSANAAPDVHTGTACDAYPTRNADNSNTVFSGLTSPDRAGGAAPDASAPRCSDIPRHWTPAAPDSEPAARAHTPRASPAANAAAPPP